jgi:hypothetical protein
MLYVANKRSSGSNIAGATHLLPTALQMVHNAIDYVAQEKHAVLNI